MMPSLSKNLPHDLHADISFPFLTCIATDAAPFILFVSHHIMYKLCATPLDTDFVTWHRSVVDFHLQRQCGFKPVPEVHTLLGSACYHEGALVYIIVAALYEGNSLVPSKVKCSLRIKRYYINNDIENRMYQNIKY